MGRKEGEVLVSLKGEEQKDGNNSKGRQEKPSQIQLDLALGKHQNLLWGYFCSERWLEGA